MLDATAASATRRTLLAQRIFDLVLGYEDPNDHDELRKDPPFAVLAGKLSPVLRGAGRQEHAQSFRTYAEAVGLDLASVEPGHNTAPLNSFKCE